MCGIAGWSGGAGATLTLADLARLSERLRHRGPDGEGEWRDEAAGVAIAHRRLAILDLTAASAQPMVDPATGVVLAYNGELYNFRELRSELTSLGHVFTTRGDVEVVLKALIEWRERAFERFAGMFAIAAWDPRDQTLWLARDALGMKPLYLTRVGGALVFASEVKALFTLPGFAPRLDPTGIAEYLEFGYRIEESATMIAGVTRLAPAEVLGVREGEVVRRFRHFAPPVPDPRDLRSGDERAEELLATLRTVVEQHLVADVPVGLLLSGGLDSSLVAALAKGSGAPLTTMSMGFAESGHDEREWGRRMAAAIGSRHLEFAITPTEVMAEIESSAWVFDDLFADWGTITTRLLYRHCREAGLKVALVGEGADELFGGYPSFRRARAAWTPWAVAGLYRSYVSRRWGGLFGKFRATLAELARAAPGDLFEAVRRFEIQRQLPGNYVMKVDKASMSVSLEARAPYLDRRVAEIALRTPAEWLLLGESEKWLLRRAATLAGNVPVEIVDRPKVGGSIAASWLDDAPAFRQFARERVLRSGGWAARLGLERAMKAYFSGARVLPFPNRLSHLGHLGWRLLLLDLWTESYGIEEVA